MRPAFPYYGGKYHLRKWIIEHFPPHYTYVEPYGGSAIILLSKPPSPVEVYNDIYGDLVHFFKTIQDPTTFEKFMQRAQYTIRSRQLYNEYKQSLQDIQDPIERAYRWWYVATQTFSGKWGSGWHHTTCGKRKHLCPSEYMQRLASIHQRIQGVFIEHLDAVTVINTYASPRTLMYLDPPYILDTRLNDSKAYQHEMTLQQWQDLLDAITNNPSMIILSHHPSDLLDQVLVQQHGWSKTCTEVSTPSVGITRLTNKTTRPRRIECLYINPKASHSPSLLI